MRELYWFSAGWLHSHSITGWIQEVTTVVKTIIFLGAFLMIAPQSREFLFSHLTSAGERIHAWAPFSYIAVMLFLIAPFASMYLVRKWPAKPEPEDPMAKYKKDIIYED